MRPYMVLQLHGECYKAINIHLFTLGMFVARVLVGHLLKKKNKTNLALFRINEAYRAPLILSFVWSHFIVLSLHTEGHYRK